MDKGKKKRKYNCRTCGDTGVVPVGRNLCDVCPDCKQRIDPDIPREYLDEEAAQLRMRKSA